MTARSAPTVRLILEEGFVPTASDYARLVAQAMAAPVTPLRLCPDDDVDQPLNSDLRETTCPATGKPCRFGCFDR